MINQKITRLSLGNYYKNFETGDEQHFTKIKPVNMLKGSSLVELFNAENGKKTEEVKSENVVNDSLAGYMYNLITSMIFCKYLDTSTYFNLFGNLVATDSDSAEDSTLKYLKGSIVAWANKWITYIGASTKLGTINTSESDLSDPEALKFVFDWATSSGNGTIATLWWLPAFMTTQPSVFKYSMDRINPDPPSISPAPKTTRMCFYKNTLYYIYSTSVYKAVTDITNTYGLPNSTGVSVKNLSGDDSAPQGVDFDGTNFWVYGSGSGKMYKYDTSFTLVTSWDCASATYIPSPYQFTCFNGKIYTYKYVNSTTWNLYEFDTSGNLTNTFNLYGTYDTFANAHASSAYLYNDGTYMYLVYCSTTSLQIKTDGTVRGDVSSNFTATGNACGAYDSYKNMWTWDASNLRRFKPYYTPIIQNLLSVPITKTSANTMKITYTFNLDLTDIY